MTAPDEIASGIEEAGVTVLLDVRHPLAYLALAPAAAFGRERGIDMNWLPLVSQPLNAPSEPGPDDDRSILHRRHRANAIRREIDTYAEAAGLVLREPYRAPDPSAFCRAWLWVRAVDAGRLEAFLTEGFRAYWALELDPADPAAVCAVVAKVGGDAEACRAWCDAVGQGALDALQGELRERGCSGVPSYLVGDEFFQGRQHLPMIGWLLDGKPGRGPI